MISPANDETDAPKSFWKRTLTLKVVLGFLFIAGLITCIVITLYTSACTARAEADLTREQLVHHTELTRVTREHAQAIGQRDRQIGTLREAELLHQTELAGAAAAIRKALSAEHTKSITQRDTQIGNLREELARSTTQATYLTEQLEACRGELGDCRLQTTALRAQLNIVPPVAAAVSAPVEEAESAEEFEDAVLGSYFTHDGKQIDLSDAQSEAYTAYKVLYEETASQKLGEDELEVHMNYFQTMVVEHFIREVQEHQCEYLSDAVDAMKADGDTTRRVELVNTFEAARKDNDKESAILNIFDRLCATLEKFDEDDDSEERDTAMKGFGKEQLPTSTERLQRQASDAAKIAYKTAEIGIKVATNADKMYKILRTFGFC